jgi:hypothetical protein
MSPLLALAFGAGLLAPVNPCGFPLLAWCAARVPDRALHQVRVECEVADRHLTIVERRAPWREDFGPEWTRFPIARLRYTKTRNTWSLYWRDRNLRFHTYDPLPATGDIEQLLAEIDRNPSGIFWG